jgi:vacuole morphology and inheritance protein 14
LSDGNREIRQAADSALAEFLREIKQSDVVEFGPMVSILVSQCNSKERFNRLTAINWVQEFINLGGDQLLLFYSELLGAIMYCISDSDGEIRLVIYTHTCTSP